MSTLKELAADATKRMEQSNPTVQTQKSAEDRKRIPLSVPMRKLEVPDIPGYYLRWFRGTPGRLAQAERAGFIFVQPEEVALNNLSLGGDATKAGNSDMGSRVSVIEGSEVSDDGQAVRMYLMKQLMEHRLEDTKIAQERNDSVADALSGAYAEGRIGAGQGGETQADAGLRYVDTARTKLPDLFRRKTAR